MKRKGYLYAVLAMLGWGTMFVAAKYALEVFLPGTIMFFRYAICVLILLLVYRRTQRPKIARKDYKYVAFIGIYGYFFSILLQQIGTNMVAASMASLINTMTPVGIILFAIFILHEKSSPMKITGIMITVVGAAIIGGGAGGGNSAAGIAVNVAGMLAWALTSVIIRKTCYMYDGNWLTIYTSVLAMLCCIPFPVYQAVSDTSLGHPGILHIAAVLWIGIVCTAGANLWWTKALEIHDANTCSLFYALLPVSTTILGRILLGERMTASFFIGGAVIIIGMAVAVISQRRHQNAPRP